jgi:addiction module RelE/StbE family toxin
VTIRYSRQFVKQLAKQPVKVRQATYLRIRLFTDNPFDPLLRNHPLQGKLKGLYSINVTGDVRAIYEIIGDEIYLYQMVGTHSQLYG